MRPRVRIAACFVALWLACAQAWAAVHYISSSGTDTWANSTTEATPCSWATMLTNAAAGDDCRVMSGTYARTTATDALTNAGTAAAPILIEGADASGNPLTVVRSNGGTGPLVTTGMPLITFTSGSFQFSGNTIVQDLRLLCSARGNDAFVRAINGTNWLIGCSISCSGAGGAASAAVSLANRGYILMCDITADCTANQAAVFVGGVWGRLSNDRISCANGSAVYLNTACSPLWLSNSVVFNSTIGINNSDGSYAAVAARHCTLTSCATAAYRGSNANYVTSPEFSDCMITDCGMAFKSLYAGTGSLAILRYNNRTRDNAAPDSGFGGWPIINPITTDTGGPDTDYVDAAGGDFRLRWTSPGKRAASDGGDVGACPVIGYPRLFGGRR